MTTSLNILAELNLLFNTNRLVIPYQNYTVHETIIPSQVSDELIVRCIFYKLRLSDRARIQL